MRPVTLASLPLLLTLAAPLPAQPEWHQWRGADRDGHSQETGLLHAWPEGGLRPAIQVGGMGAGYSSFAASGDRLLTMGARGDTERVMAIEARTGLILWSVPNGPIYRDSKGDGPRGTPTIDGDRVFALGGNGRLVSLDLDTGKVIWQVDLLSAFGAHNITWGISESPLVVDGKVLVNAGGRDASVVALDRDTGKVVWKSESDEAGYSSAVLADVGGRRQAIFLTGRRALGVDIRDGKLLWGYEQVANRTANVATPIVRGNEVFLSTDYGTGCALLRLGTERDGSGAEQVYFNRDMRNHHSSSVLVDGTLYGFSSSILTAMDFETGAVRWRDRSVGKGSVITADGDLYLLSENGVLGLARATADGYQEVGRFRLPAPSGSPTWSHPMIHRHRLYLRDQDTLFAFDVAASDQGTAAAARH